MEAKRERIEAEADPKPAPVMLEIKPTDGCKYATFEPFKVPIDPQTKKVTREWLISEFRNNTMKLNGKQLKAMYAAKCMPSNIDGVPLWHVANKEGSATFYCAALMHILTFGDGDFDWECERHIVLGIQDGYEYTEFRLTEEQKQDEDLMWNLKYCNPTDDGAFA